MKSMSQFEDRLLINFLIKSHQFLYISLYNNGLCDINLFLYFKSFRYSDYIYLYNQNSLDLLYLKIFQMINQFYILYIHHNAHVYSKD